MSSKAVIGVDLGGTNVRSAVVQEDGSIVPGTRVELPSNAQSGVGPVFEALAQAILASERAFEGRVEGVGVAIPGIIDDEAGVVRWAPNFGKEENGFFRYWENIPFRQNLEPKIKRPVAMGNDANLAALGEYAFGAGKNDANCLVMLTLGTGIGGGVVLSPRSVQSGLKKPTMLLGGNKGGVELGHILLSRGGLDCNAGSYGALEAYCQRDAIVRRALHKLRRGEESTLRDLVKGDLGAISPRLLADAAEAGDPMAQSIWDEVGEWLGAGVGCLVNAFAPDVFVIGGQIAKSWHLLAPSTNKAAESVAIPALWRDCRLSAAEQIDDAGLLGAAKLAFDSREV